MEETIPIGIPENQNAYSTEILPEVRWKDGVLMQKRRVWGATNHYKDEWFIVPEMG